jgi:hypothetical protein
MKMLIFLAIGGCQIVSGIISAAAQESAPAEIIRHISPDKKFAMRILCDSEPEDRENIDANSVRSVDIVSLPQKEVVSQLPFGGYDGFELVWASDSKWCAFYSLTGTRAGETSVFRLQGDKFVMLETERMSVDVKGDTRNQYVEPVRWVKPGTLLLKQFTIFRGGGDSTIQFTVRFDDDGKFHVISKKKLRS